MPQLADRTDFALVGGRALTMAGPPIDDATVVVRDGKITAVGPARKVKVPRGVEKVDARGSWVLPGFVEAHAHVGIYEESQGWAGSDTNELTDPNGARLRAIDAINPDDEGFRDGLAGGVTTCVVKPGSGNPVGGQTVALKCWGRVVDEMVLKAPCSVKSALGENPKRVYGDKKTLPSTRLGVAAVIRDAFTAAQDYAAKRARKGGEDEARNTTHEVLAKVLSGELPWSQHCHRADDIATAVRLSEEFGYRLVVNHGTEAHLIAGYLAERGIPVIIGPLFTSRSKVELRERSLRNPGRLHRAGLKIAITTDHPVVPIGFLVYQVAISVKEGLDRDEALKTITINPAEIMGLDDRVGSLEVGKDADLTVWSGDPLDVYSRCRQTYIDGRLVYEWNEAAGEGTTARAFDA